MKTYDRDSWFEECRKWQPDISDEELAHRWEVFWTVLAEMHGWEIVL